MLNYNDFPIGITDFSEIIEKKCILIDKTMLIKDIMDEKTKAILITRPRRFGKTLNMNMLGEFFSLTGKDVFEGLNISKETQFCTQHQNQYPVISITFKECKGLHLKSIFKQIKNVFKKCYEAHAYLSTSSALSTEKKKDFDDILNGRIEDPDKLAGALVDLISYIHAHTGKKTMVLIDEYDSPIHSAYANGFYDQIINFMRAMLGSALKDNSYLEKAIITGITRIAKESMFLGLNHLKCYTLMDKKYAQYFGFTGDEVESLLPPSFSSREQSPKEPSLETANATPESEVLRGFTPLDDKKGDGKGVVEEIKRWYNGYKIGDYQIYNPWSIMHCLQNDMTMGPYWLNTSDNALVYELFGNSNLDFKNKIKDLIKGIPQEQIIEDNLTFREMKGDSIEIWTLLFHAGYLNISSRWRNFYGKVMTSVEIPNKEILLLYIDIVERWFYINNSDHEYKNFINSLDGDNPDDFFKFVSSYINGSMSYFDLSTKTPEHVFHAFMMGLLVGFSGKYDVDSNGEAGDGRYDVIMTPKNPKDKAISIEFKACSNVNKLEETAKEALKQISDKKYTDAFTGKTLCIGMAFCGKKMVGQSSLMGDFT